MANEIILEMKNITKEFPGVKALDNVKLTLKKGEVHALMGENGAGKSTLMKILCGAYTNDKGNISVKGKEVSFHSTKDAIDHGITMIYQELNLVPEMTIAENIFLGRESSRAKCLINKSEMNRKAKELLDELGMSVSPKMILGELTVAGQQMIEIAKAVSYHSDVMIMDEPTSAISEKEVEQLFRIIRSLTEKGVAIVYISHKMDEIFQIADTITILRDGQWVLSKPASELDDGLLIQGMVGRELGDYYPKKAAKIGETVFKVEGLDDGRLIRDISFDVKAGEVLGFAGLMGAGRTETAEMLFGLRKKKQGTLYLEGKKIKVVNPNQAVKEGIAYVPEDRKLRGLNLIGSVKDNIVISDLKRLNKNLFLNTRKLNKVADEQIKLLSIKTPDREALALNLSGGNQQKIVFVKWLLTNPKVLILDEPTRGIDIGAKTEIYELINQLAAKGIAVIMISSEMPEVLGISDRILVFSEGRITGELKREEFSQELVMQYATPHKEGQE